MSDTVLGADRADLRSSVSAQNNAAVKDRWMHRTPDGKLHFLPLPMKLDEEAALEKAYGR
jgi:hypothetical protein